MISTSYPTTLVIFGTKDNGVLFCFRRLCLGKRKLSSEEIKEINSLLKDCKLFAEQIPSQEGKPYTYSYSNLCHELTHMAFPSVRKDVKNEISRPLSSSV